MATVILFIAIKPQSFARSRFFYLWSVLLLAQIIYMGAIPIETYLCRHDVFQFVMQCAVTASAPIAALYVLVSVRREPER